MYAEPTAPRATPVAANASRAALRACLAELAELLAAAAEERALLRAKIQEAQRAMRNAGADDGLLALLLRNMLVDLTKTPGRFDAAYFTQQLSGIISRLS